MKILKLIMFLAHIQTQLLNYEFGLSNSFFSGYNALAKFIKHELRSSNNRQQNIIENDFLDLTTNNISFKLTKYNAIEEILDNKVFSLIKTFAQNIKTKDTRIYDYLVNNFTFY